MPKPARRRTPRTTGYEVMGMRKIGARPPTTMRLIPVRTRRRLPTLVARAPAVMVAARAAMAGKEMNPWMEAWSWSG